MINQINQNNQNKQSIETKNKHNQLKHNWKTKQTFNWNTKQTNNWNTVNWNTIEKQNNQINWNTKQTNNWNNQLKHNWKTKQPNQLKHKTNTIMQRSQHITTKLADNLNANGNQCIYQSHHLHHRQNGKGLIQRSITTNQPFFHSFSSSSLSSHLQFTTTSICTKTNASINNNHHHRHTNHLTRMFVRNKSTGIVGLPNVGKSTIFNALTRTQVWFASEVMRCWLFYNLTNLWFFFSHLISSHLTSSHDLIVLCF